MKEVYISDINHLPDVNYIRITYDKFFLMKKQHHKCKDNLLPNSYFYYFKCGICGKVYRKVIGRLKRVPNKMFPY